MPSCTFFLSHSNAPETIFYPYDNANAYFYVYICY